MEHIISVLVENKFGVLSRIANLFSGRGYNIETLSVAPTLDASISMMTIVTSGDDRIIEQIVNQLGFKFHIAADHVQGLMNVLWQRLLTLKFQGGSYHRCERRPQFVTGIGSKLALARERGFQPVKHPIKGGRQFSQFISTRDQHSSPYFTASCALVKSFKYQSRPMRACKTSSAQS